MAARPFRVGLGPVDCGLAATVVIRFNAQDIALLREAYSIWRTPPRLQRFRGTENCGKIALSLRLARSKEN
jgi:hypothetical protein